MASALSLEGKLKRMLYLNRIDSDFYIGNPDLYQIDVSLLRRSTIQEVIESDLKQFLSVLDAANADESIPRRQIIFFVLGKLMNQEELAPNKKQQISAKIVELIQSDCDLFTFIKYYTQGRSRSKIPSSVQNIIRKYYTNKSPAELAISAARVNRIHKWSHKDLIKLAHFKSDTPLKNSVINYILTQQISDKATEGELKVLEILKKSNELRRTKESVDAVPIIATHKLSIDQVSSSLRRNAEVWLAAIENMTIQEILPHLLKLYNHGFLKAGSDISNHLLDVFTNPEKIRENGAHPMEIFIQTKKFEKGGKPMDLKLLNYLQTAKKLSQAGLEKVQVKPQINCPHIINALNTCFDLACSNVVPTNKRYLITIDVTPEAKRAHCIGSKFLSLLEAAVGYAIFLLRVEKDVLVSTYKAGEIDLLSFGKRVTYSDLLYKVSLQASPKTHLFAPVDWAAGNKKHIDVFVNFIHNNCISTLQYSKTTKRRNQKIQCEAMIKYRSKVNLPNSKFLTFAPVERSQPLWADAPANVLNILGFDAVACRVSECFSRGTFC